MRAEGKVGEKRERRERERERNGNEREKERETETRERERVERRRVKIKTSLFVVSFFLNSGFDCKEKKAALVVFKTTARGMEKGTGKAGRGRQEKKEKREEKGG